MLFPAFGLNLSLSFKHLHNCLTKVLVAFLKEVQHFAGLETCIFQSPMMTIILIVVPAIKSFPFQSYFRVIYLSTYLISRFLTFYFPFYQLLLIALNLPVWPLSLFPPVWFFPASYGHKAVGAVIQQLPGQQGLDNHPTGRQAVTSVLQAAEKVGGGIHP